MKLGMCGCESSTCVAGIGLDYEGLEIGGTEHEAGGCCSEALLLIEIYGHKQRLCEDCYTCTVSIPDLKHVVVTDLRRN